MRRRVHAGFTLVELTVTVVVVALLAAVAVPIYRGHAKRAMAAEGMGLVSAIRTAQRIWFAEYNTYTDNWLDIAGQVDYSKNRYFFTAPTLTASGRGSEAAFTATVVGSGDAAGVTVMIDEAGTITITGL